ncbi:gamma-aminobutyric acid receptor subunit rho-3-like [Eriocheir sinensis]|uniref:gamma-aminobutyric acid receptor subunit rho-3-like n=1 Tax=Eriocheir sinensis TaxID=95602 RepID=UPI0021C75648|nr:gamma-aminobutyric acid receptor subunit rho-3-like [Eriocheir sinensis]
MIEVGYTLTRRFTLIALSLYLPSLIVLTIGYGTLFVRVQQLEVRLAVSLTTLLVLYTFFNQTSSSLPQTAYVKMVDAWFFFCTILLFCIIMAHIYVERMNTSPVEPLGQRGNGAWQTAATHKRRRMLPETFLTVLRTYVCPAVVTLFFIVYGSIMFA